MHFAAWFEMTWPLVVVATESLKEKGDSVKSKDESYDESDLDYGDDEDEDTGMESQDDQTRNIYRKRNDIKEGERTKAALAAERSKKRKKSIEKYGSGNLDEQGWELENSIYLDVQENNNLNSWFNETIHREMKQSSFSNKDMMDYYTAKTVFGSKMISTVEAMKLKYRLRQKDVFEIYYNVALPGPKELEYTPHCDNCEYTFIHTFTEMDFILKLKGGDHYFKVPARSGLILIPKLKLTIVENNTKVQHRYVTVEFARKEKSV